MEQDVLSLPLDVWRTIVECFTLKDLHTFILTSKGAYEVAHMAQPSMWRHLSIKPSPTPSESWLNSTPEEIKQVLQHRRYRCVSSLTIRGTWSGELLFSLLDLVSKEIRELDLDAPAGGWSADGICETIQKIGKSLRKLVLGYWLFVAEPSLPTVIAENCPNLVHFEMKTPPLGHGVNQALPIPPSLPSLCPNLHTFGWVCYPSMADKFDLTPISNMRKLHSLNLSNLSILDNKMFYANVINSGLPLTTLELTLPHTFQHQGLSSFASLSATLHTLRLYNCSYDLRPLQLDQLPHLRTVLYYTSLRECDFETIHVLTSLPLDTLEVRFQSSLRSIQLRERFVQLMSSKKNYKLTTRGTLYDTFCYTISA